MKHRCSRFVSPLVAFLLGFCVVLLARPAQAAVSESVLVGTYRNLSFNVDGVGGADRLMRPLILFSNHTYTWGQEQGTWTLSGDKLSFSERPTWGDGTVNLDLQIQFVFVKGGKHFTVTMYHADDATGTPPNVSPPSAPPKQEAPPPKAAATKPPDKITLNKVVTVQSEGVVNAAALLPDDSLLVAARGDNTYRLFDPKTGQKSSEFTVEPTAEPGYEVMPDENRAIAVTPDGKRMFELNYMAKTVGIIDLSTHKYIGAIAVDGSPYRFKVVYNDGAVVVHDRGSQVIFLKDMKGGDSLPIDDIAFAPDFSHYYYLHAPQKSRDHPMLSIIEAKTDNAQEKRTELDLGPVDLYDGGALEMSPDGKSLYILLAGNRVMVLDTAAAKIRATLVLPIEPKILYMMLSPDGRLLALWAPEKGSIGAYPSSKPGYEITHYIQVSGQVTVLDTATFEPLKLDATELDAPQNLAFSPDSRFLFVPNRRSEVVVFSTTAKS